MGSLMSCSATSALRSAWFPPGASTRTSCPSLFYIPPFTLTFIPTKDTTYRAILRFGMMLKDASTYQCVVHTPTWTTEGMCLDCVMALLLLKLDTKWSFTILVDKDVITLCSLGLILKDYKYSTGKRSYWANYSQQPSVWIESAFSILFWLR